MASVTEQIIKKYCGSVEQRIAACCDERVAQYLKNNLHSEIQKKCGCEAIAKFLDIYIENLIREKFNANNS